MLKSLQRNDRNYFRFITVISIVVPVVVALLFVLPKASGELGFNIYILPRINAVINTAVSILLVMGYFYIRKKNITAHRNSMGTAFLLSALFLISYVIYHRYGHTKFGGEGTIKAVYLLILATHIILSAFIVPMVLVTIYYSTSGQIEKHRKLARWTLPIWLYVSVTGVIVYLMIEPYYPA